MAKETSESGINLQSIEHHSQFCTKPSNAFIDLEQSQVFKEENLFDILNLKLEKLKFAIGELTKLKSSKDYKKLKKCCCELILVDESKGC